MWPTNAVPEHWIVSLFARMQATYGARFSALWADTDLELVKRVWAEALALVAADDLRRAVVALATEKRPPDLPRFLELCEPVPAAQRTDGATARLPYVDHASPEVVAESVARMRKSVEALDAPEPTPLWAFELLRRGLGKNGRPLTHEARRVAVDAVTSAAGCSYFADAGNAFRARMRSTLDAAMNARGATLQSRDPGEDDEELAQVTA